MQLKAFFSLKLWKNHFGKDKLNVTVFDDDLLMDQYSCFGSFLTDIAHCSISKYTTRGNVFIYNFPNLT